MIRIHRSKPLARIGARTVRLSHAQHALLTILGMMDNRLVPHTLLLELVREHPVPISADRDALWGQTARLRRKLGGYVENRRHLGYQLTGEVEFYGEPLPW